MDAAGQGFARSGGASRRDIDLVEQDIASRGVRLANDRLNTGLSEARQARVALGRPLGLVDIPEEAATSSLHARKAARARWAEAG